MEARKEYYLQISSAGVLQVGKQFFKTGKKKVADEVLPGANGSPDSKLSTLKGKDFPAIISEGKYHLRFKRRFHLSR